MAAKLNNELLNEALTLLAGRLRLPKWSRKSWWFAEGHH